MIKGSKQIWGTVKGSKIKKRFENSICFTFHLATCYFMYPICKILAKCMTAMLLLVENGPFAPRTGTGFGNFIYTAMFCNDTPLS